MTFKVVAVLLAKVREERVTTGAEMRSAISENLGVRACFEEGIFVCVQIVVANDDVADRDEGQYAHDVSAQQFCELLTLQEEVHVMSMSYVEMHGY